MPLPALKVWVADEDFFATDINGNFTIIKNKFSETAGVGIGDGDVATDAGISGLKLSNASGKQIPTDRLAPDAVDATILRDDAITDANRSVTSDHIRNLAVTTGKLALDAVVHSKIKKLLTTVAFVSTTPLAQGSSIQVDISLSNGGLGANCTVTNPTSYATNVPMAVWGQELLAPNANIGGRLIPRLHRATGTDKLILLIHNAGTVGSIELNGLSFVVLTVTGS